jgi:hypothetical protein
MWKYSQPIEAYSDAFKLVRSGLPIASLEIFSPELLKLKASILKELPDASVLSSQSVLFSDTNYTLAIEVNGSKALIDSTIFSASGILNKQPELLEDTAASTFWRLLADLPLSVPCPSYAQIVLPCSHHFELLSNLSRQLNYAFQVRPRLGQLRLLISDAQQMPVLHSILEQYSTTADLRADGLLIAASSTDEYEYCVHYYPPLNQYITRIKDEIKHRYDPANCLNPQVKM